MSSNSGIPKWVANRILGFFNRAKNINDIVDGTIKDDPSDGPGNTIGRQLADRILRTRNQLRPFRRFTAFEQLDDIQGVGQGTIDDLVYTFGTSAAQGFRERMYNDSIIYEANWPLEFFRYEIEDQEAFNELAYDEEAFRKWLIQRVGELCGERQVNDRDCNSMLEDLREAYLDKYFNSTPAAGYALALWFYQFDADNWFSWDRIQEACIGYFDHHSGAYPWEMELRLMRGFTQRGIIQPGITPDALPVVFNWPEQCITLWFSALYD
jgi:hypothetical protein